MLNHPAKENTESWGKWVKKWHNQADIVLSFRVVFPVHNKVFLSLINMKQSFYGLITALVLTGLGKT